MTTNIKKVLRVAIVCLFSNKQEMWLTADAFQKHQFCNLRHLKLQFVHLPQTAFDLNLKLLLDWKSAKQALLFSKFIELAVISHHGLQSQNS